MVNFSNIRKHVINTNSLSKETYVAYSKIVEKEQKFLFLERNWGLRLKLRQ